MKGWIGAMDWHTVYPYLLADSWHVFVGRKCVKCLSSTFACVYHGVQVEVRGWSVGVGSHLLAYGSQRSELCQIWWQVPFPAEHLVGFRRQF